MYNKQIKFLIWLTLAMLLICILRLAQMQLLQNSYYQKQIELLKQQSNSSQQLKTIRGTIYDRNNRPLAADEPHFKLHITYELTRYMDERFLESQMIQASRTKNPVVEIDKTQRRIDENIENLQRIVDKLVINFGAKQKDIDERIKEINDDIWRMCSYLAWRRDFKSVEDFNAKYPNREDRILRISRVDLLEMHQSYDIADLQTDNDIFKAQLEFMDTPGITILPKARRSYPYGSVASQTIGWVGEEQKKKLFAQDRFKSYLEGEVSGRRPGVEYVCEKILRGSRGELIYDIDSKLINRTENQLGSDVHLTLDIELQKKIENYLLDSSQNPYWQLPTAAVVIEVATGDILAMVSVPTFDLNMVNSNYNDYIADPNKPMINRAINGLYPPGSVAKPIILIAAMQTGKATPAMTISCPNAKVEKPTCLAQTRFHNCHDYKWQNEGGNNARNAIKGSCNVYFSRLAARIDPRQLQRWFFNFGYGQQSLPPPLQMTAADEQRNFLQAQGQISNVRPQNIVTDFKDIPPLSMGERRWFGIGQGNLRVTPLQVANAMAAIARGGIYKRPRLYLDDDNATFEEISLKLSKTTLDTVRDGMRAVVNETGGTANTAFNAELKNLAARNVTVFGKTGSTQNPETAWFGGFAEDSTGPSIAVAVVVEKGKSGSGYAAPRARDIINFCIEAGYIGTPVLAKK